MNATQVYTMMVHKAEEGGYWAEIAELPGCVTQGATLEELRANGLEAMEAALEVDTKDMQLTGVTPPDEDIRPYQQFNSWTG